MNKPVCKTLAQEIAQCMSGLTEIAEGRISARFVFPADFIGFQGHFPGRPILPGVCKIRAAIVMLEAWRKDKIMLDEIVLAKFFSTATCAEALDFVCVVTRQEGPRARVDVSVTRHQEKIAQLKLQVISMDE